MNTEFVFYGDSILLDELEAFLIGQGITAKKEVIIRASEPRPSAHGGAREDLIRVVESIERIAKAYLAFLDSKGVKLRLRIKGADESIKLVKGDTPEKMVGFVKKQKAVVFDLDVIL